METNAQGNLVPANLGAKPEVVETKVEPTIPNADKALDAIKARVHAANPHLDNPDLPNRLKKPIATAVEIKKSDEPVKEDIDLKPNDKAVLSELAKAQSNLREAQAKVKELETRTADSEYGADIRKLWSGTDADKLSVLGKLSGKDPTEALADLVEMFYNQEGGTGTTSQPKPTDANQELIKRLEDMAAQIKELKELPVKQHAQVSQEQLVSGTRAFLKSHLDKLKLEISSRPENTEEAIDKALAKAPEIVKKLGYDPANLSPEQADKLAQEAIQAAESEFEQLGKRFSKTPEPARPSIYDKPLPRSAPRLDMTKDDANPVPSGKGWEDYKERVRNAWEASRR